MLAPAHFGAFVLAAALMAAVGCAGRSGGVIEETDAFSFDEISAAAAAETEDSETGPQ